jgi:curved DNA-binding protein CbpA
VVKAAKKTADLALKYYFEMLGLPLTASENEVRAAYSYI